MDIQEIKTHLAIAAIVNGLSVAEIQPYYDWIVSEEKTGKKKRRSRLPFKTPVEELTQRTEHCGAITNLCHNHDIETLEHLILCGGQRFSRFYDVPNALVEEIDKAFKDWYNIQDWMTY